MQSALSNPPNTTALTWLHISDFHFDSRDRFDRDAVLGALLQSLPDLVSRAGSPDLVFATGDIANSGLASEYQHATAFFDSLLARLGLPRERLVVVPGNHDVDRSKGSGLARSLSSIGESDTYFDVTSECLHATTRMAAYAAWYNGYFASIRSFSAKSSIIDRIEFNIRGQRISVCPINSALFSFDSNDYGQLWLGRSSVMSIEDDADSDLRIALMHHPLDWLHHLDVQTAKSALRSCFDCILTGHLHQNDAETVVGVSGGSLHLSAGATYQTSKWPNTAMFASLGNGEVSVFPIHYVQERTPRWVLDTGVFAQSKDYVGTFKIPRHADTVTRPPAIHILTSQPPNTLESARRAFESDLFTIHGHTIHMSPRLMDRPQERSFAEEGTAAIAVADVAADKESYVIEVQPEYGGTTLARHLELLILEIGSSSVSRRDARSLSNYRKKLEIELPSPVDGTPATLILDNFEFDRDEKLLKEIQSLSRFERLIIVSLVRGLQPQRSVDSDLIDRGFKYIYLWGVERSSIRAAAATILDTADENFVSSVTSKVYDDLLNLCIPLTPSNVIMYLQILSKEGEFQPLNRVDIVSRYILSSIRRPSEAYVDSFNVKNRLDILSAFVYRMYLDERSVFDRPYWNTFCAAYRSDTLFDFDDAAFLEELLSVRIVASHGRSLYFRYSFFFVYFLGRHIEARPALLMDFLSSDEYMKIPDAIDVISALSSDNADLVKHLTSALSDRLSEFAQSYVRPSFKPLEQAVWPDSSKEDDELWAPVAEEIKRGPEKAEVVDLLKTSILSESRTIDQEVRFQKFANLEHATFSISRALTDALRNADDIPGSLKLEAYQKILEVHQTAFQIGVLLADVICKTKFFRWGGIAFIDFNRVLKGGPIETSEAQIRMIESLASAVCHKAADDLGVAKLSAVFRRRASFVEQIDYLELLNFHVLLIAKGPGWEKSAAALIEKAGKNSFYLWCMLTGLMDHFKSGLMKVRDREEAKRLIAQIEAKRTHRKDVLGSRAINRMLGHLESIDHFANFKSRNGDEPDNG